MNPVETQAANPAPEVFVGCAGWTIPAVNRSHPGIPHAGGQLERYAAVLPAAEINSSFYRPHMPETYARWAETTPPHFRFAVKMPREISHFKKLVDAGDVLTRFVGEVSELGEKLGCLLLQMPPLLTFDWRVAEDFFRLAASATGAKLVCEPRHPSWFSDDANELLSAWNITRVIADPPISGVEHVAPPKADLVYLRLHGSPVIYRSSYNDLYLEKLAEWIALQREVGLKVWCIFDNTASGAAFGNALELMSLASSQRSREEPNPQTPR
ncbi:DUF72 domain-containing protein [soil metagenome]